MNDILHREALNAVDSELRIWAEQTRKELYAYDELGKLKWLSGPMMSLSAAEQRVAQAQSVMVAAIRLYEAQVRLRNMILKSNGKE